MVGDYWRIGTQDLEYFAQLSCRMREIRPNISCYNRLMRLHARNRCDGQMAADAGHRHISLRDGEVDNCCIEALG